MIDVLTFGETMLRLSPSGAERLSRARTLESWVAGSESNVAVALVALGRTASWASRLPDNPLGRRIAGELRSLGVDTFSVIWTDPAERVGTFYFEPAAPPREALTLYDRAGSAASRLTPSDVPDALLAAHRHLHVSGITPALSPTCAETVAGTLRRAKTHGLTTSLDVNYRAKLWSPEAASSTVAPLMPQLDVLICAIGDAAQLFGIDAPDAVSCARALSERFGAHQVVVTAGGQGASAVVAGGDFASVAAFPVESSIGRLGSGDAFAAGYLAALLADDCLLERLRLGAAAAALKRTIPGDMLIATHREVDAILATEKESGWR